jgi:TIR domain
MKTDKHYDVAISFAGEDRECAEALAEALKRRGVTVFYDGYEKAALFGKNLYTHLSDVYQNQARYCVMFLSKHYAKKAWTNHEREAAQARAFREHEEYILPVRLDDTEIPGILPTIGYLKWPPESSDSIADAILIKLGRDPQAFVMLSQETRKEIREVMLQPGLTAMDKGHLIGLIAFKDLDSKRDKTLEELTVLNDKAAKRMALRDKLHESGDYTQMEKLKKEQEADKRRSEQLLQENDDLGKTRQLILSELKALNSRSLEFIRNMWEKKTQWSR